MPTLKFRLAASIEKVFLKNLGPKMKGSGFWFGLKQLREKKKVNLQGKYNLRIMGLKLRNHYGPSTVVNFNLICLQVAMYGIQV